MPKTASQLITEVRGDLDEPEAAVWRDDDLLVWCNAAIFKVAAALKRATREDWLTNRIISNSSTSSTILGETYTHSALQITSGTSRYTLPADLVEIRSWEPATQADRDTGYRLIPKDMAEQAFVHANLQDSSSTRLTYYYDLYDRCSVRIVPEPASTFHTELWYVRATVELTYDDSVSFLPDWTYEAIKAAMVYRAHKAVNHPDTGKSLSLFQAELTDISSMAAPRQSVDPVIVEGAFDEDYYSFVPESDATV